MIRELVLRLDAATQVSTKVRSDMLNHTEDHVPGWTVRGAFAAAWIARHGQPTSKGGRELFEELFEGGVRFGPAFVGRPPRSMAIVRHKYADQAECDVAEIDRVVTPSIGSGCPRCGQAWEPVRGLEDRPEVHRHTSVHVDHGDQAVEGQLFHREAMSKGQSLVGLVSGDERLLNELAYVTSVFIGGRKTTHGLATATIRPTAGRLNGEYAQDGFVIRLASPAVFVDDAGRPSLTPNLGELAAFLEAQVVVQRYWARWDHVGGWHAASGLPKPTEVVAAAGSTYVIARQDGKKVDRGALTALLERGIGLRRHEGFGHIGASTSVRRSQRDQHAFDEEVRHTARDSIHVHRRPEILRALRELVDGVAGAKERALARAKEADAVERDIIPFVTSQTSRLASKDRELLRAVLDAVEAEYS